MSPKIAAYLQPVVWPTPLAYGHRRYYLKTEEVIPIRRTCS